MHHPRIPYRAGWAMPAANKKPTANQAASNVIDLFFDHLKAGALAKARSQIDQNRRLTIAEGLDGWTALFYAIHYDAPQAAQDFALLGCDVNHTDDNGVTPLILAAIEGSLGCVEILLRFDFIDIDTQCETGATALSNAMELGHNHIARALMQRGASILLGESGKTPVELARTSTLIQRDLQALVAMRYRQMN
ncbi:ankyrin repeat domain-containing protein [Duganella vulcania]|uniref:Ankyrin repeat domain-containing protein n=1 Tax=Duganella vulcania TaxID=2692166 RepID=A0A845GJH4_9BURK|nr:ankyrin repeat domain-containing protein [Duganella vulcania]MYM92809.1 hypothetical protein [Duganella vulcania]